MGQGPITFADLFDGLGQGAADVLKFGDAVTTLNRAYRDFSKGLDAEATRVSAGLNTLLAAATGLKNQISATSVGTNQERERIDQLTTQVIKLVREQEKYKESLAGIATIRRSAKEGTDGLAKALREQQTALKAAFASGNTEGAKTAARRILELKYETQELSRALKGQNSTLNAAQGSYRQLENEARQLKERLGLLAGGVDANSQKARDLEKRLADVNGALADFRKATSEGQRSAGSYAEALRASVVALQQQQRNLIADSEALRSQARATGLSVEQQNRLQKELRETDAELAKVNGELRAYGVGLQSTQQQTGGFATGAQKAESSLTGFLASTVSAYAAIQALGQAIGAAYDDYLAFESAQSSLAAITGATGKDLEFYAQQARAIGPAMSKSGADTLKAFELIGSAQPELLKSKEALVQVTEQALLLAAAAGEELPDAANSLTTVMNQFGASSQQASRFVNVLAAGAKEGAATIGQTANSLKYAGVNAASANISIEQTVALVQTLAERSIKGEQAGVALRNVLAKLASGAKQTNPEVVGLEKALDTLGKRNLSTAAYTKLFGLENANAAKILVEGRDKVKTLTTALTGTQVATEQAARQMDNAAAAGSRLKAVVLSAGSSFLSGFSPFLKSAANGLADFIARITGLKKTVEEQVQASGRLIQSNQQQAASAQQLLNRYEKLTADGLKPTTAEKKELDSITLQLRDSLGQSVTAIDKETGALRLNKDAVREQIKQRLLLANQEASTLVLKAEAIKDRIRQEERLTKQLKSELQTRLEDVQAAGLKYAAAEAQGLLGSKKKVFTRNDKPIIDTKDVEVANAYVFTNNDLTKSLRRGSEAQAEYNRYMAELKRLGFDAAFIQKTLAGATTDTATVTDTSIKTDIAKTKSVADVAKAEYELQKQRLEATLADYQRQQGNPANTEDVRLRAAQKAAQARRELAKLERDELIREAAQTYKDQVNGQAAFEKTRLRLREQFGNQLLAIDRDLSKEELAIRNAILEQLAAVDRLIIESEIAALDEVAANENASAAERQQAAADASARRIEIILNESDVKRRAAKGDVAELRKIQAEEDKLVADALKGSRANNADFANEDALKGYERQQLALEKARAAGLVTERGYQKELVRLENDYLATKLGNLQKDSTKQREAAQLELEIARRTNEQKLEDERRTQEARAQLIHEGLQNVQQLSDAFYEIGANRREAELQDVTRRKDAELKIAGESDDRQYLESKAKLDYSRATALAAAGEDAAAKVRIEEQYARDSAAIEGQKNNLKTQIEESFRKRELAIKQKQAKADRNQALFAVALNTAQAVTAVLSTGGGTFYADLGISAAVLSGIVIAQGLAQAAAILSQPLPQYAKGRAGGPAEWALVGEKGPELVSDPAGGAQLFSSPTVTYLSQGATVHTATQTRDILREKRFVENRLLTHQYQGDLADRTRQLERASVPAPDTIAQRTEAAIAQSTREIVRAVQERPEQRLTERGLETFTRRGNNVTQHTNQRNRRH